MSNSQTPLWVMACGLVLFVMALLVEEPYEVRIYLAATGLAFLCFGTIMSVFDAVMNKDYSDE